jgi:hypothetical protein
MIYVRFLSNLLYSKIFEKKKVEQIITTLLVTHTQTVYVMKSKFKLKTLKLNRITFINIWKKIKKK